MRKRCGLVIWKHDHLSFLVCSLIRMCVTITPDIDLQSFSCGFDHLALDVLASSTAVKYSIQYKHPQK